MAHLIYQAGFNDPALEPLIDANNLGPLQLTQAPVLPGTAAEKMKIVPLTSLTPPTPGARFTLKRTDPPPVGGPSNPCDNQDDCYVGAVVNPFPHGIHFFKIRATFQLPKWESETQGDHRWAMVVFARSGNVSYWPRRYERTTVTLQSSSKTDVLAAQMNTPCGAAPGTPYPYGSGAGGGTPVPVSVYKDIFESIDPERTIFTLELLIDTEGEVARARLSAFWKYVEQRWFINPLIAGDLKSPIDSVGFAIANADGIGSASATIVDFRIYRLTAFEIWFARFCRLIATILAPILAIPTQSKMVPPVSIRDDAHPSIMPSLA